MPDNATTSPDAVDDLPSKDELMGELADRRERVTELVDGAVTSEEFLSRSPR